MDITVQRNINPLVDENRLQLEAAKVVTVSAGSNIALQGSNGTTGVPMYMQVTMTADEVAQEIQRALADFFAAGTTSAYPIRGGDTLSVTGLTVTDAGPFGLTNAFVGDLFSAYNSGTNFQGLTPNAAFPGSLQSRANTFEGAYVDDFVIGLAGRGELVTGGTNGNTNFITDPQLTLTNPATFNPEILVGPYQVEIRGGEEYGVPSLPGFPVTIDLDQALAIDSRLSRGVSVQFNAASSLVAGTTFTVTDGTRVVTIELDDENDGIAVQPGNIPLPFSTAVVDPITLAQTSESAAIIAARFRDIVNSPAVQAQLKGVAVTLLNSDRVGSSSDTAVIIGGDVNLPTSVGTRTVATGTGGSNRERPQGQVVVDSVRVSNSRGFGVTVEVAPRDTATNAASPGTPRNTVTINDERLTPGAVIMNSEFLFNQSGGISIVGDAGGANLPAASVPFVRLVNNTIVGGSIAAVTNTIR